MTISKLCLLAVCILGAAGLGPARAQTAPAAGYLPIDETIDVLALEPDVNIHFPKFLLNDLAADLKNAPDNPLAKIGVDPHALVRDIRRVRLLVIGIDDANRDAVRSATQELEKILLAQWVPMIRVTEENVGIYTVGDATGEQMAGLAMVILQEDTAIVGNIEGSIPFGLLLQIAGNLDALPKDFLGQLGGQDAGAGEEQPVEEQPDAAEGN